MRIFYHPALAQVVKDEIQFFPDSQCDQLTATDLKTEIKDPSENPFSVLLIIPFIEFYFICSFIWSCNQFM